MASENTNVVADEVNDRSESSQGGSIDLGYLKTLACIPSMDDVALFLKNKAAYLAELEKWKTDLAKEKLELTKELTKEELAKAEVADLVQRIAELDKKNIELDEKIEVEKTRQRTANALAKEFEATVSQMATDWINTIKTKFR